MSNDGNLPDCADENFQKMMTIGPISRYAEDLKLALGVMAGPEAKLLNLDTPVAKQSSYTVFFPLEFLM